MKQPKVKSCETRHSYLKIYRGFAICDLTSVQSKIFCGFAIRDVAFPSQKQAPPLNLKKELPPHFAVNQQIRTLYCVQFSFFSKIIYQKRNETELPRLYI